MTTPANSKNKPPHNKKLGVAGSVVCSSGAWVGCGVVGRVVAVLVVGARVAVLVGVVV